MQSFPGKLKACRHLPAKVPLLPGCQEYYLVSLQVTLCTQWERNSLSLRIWGPGCSSSSLAMSLGFPSYSWLPSQFLGVLVNILLPFRFIPPSGVSATSASVQAASSQVQV